MPGRPGMAGGARCRRGDDPATVPCPRGCAKRVTAALAPGTIRRLAATGRVRLAGIREPHPASPRRRSRTDPVRPSSPPTSGARLDATGARIAVICTPIPTHTDLALTAARAVHLLLEKRLAPLVRRVPLHGRRGRAGPGWPRQIGFQSPGSHAVPAIRCGSSPRARSARSPGSAGPGPGPGRGLHRRAPRAAGGALNGVDVVDGSYQPLAHAVATGLALLGPPAPRTSPASRPSCCAPIHRVRRHLLRPASARLTGR